MRRTIPALIIMLLVLANVAHGQAETNWERTGFNLPDFFGSDTERGFSYGEFDGEPRLLVVSRSTAPPTIHVLDAETGLDAGTLSTEGVAGGTYQLNDVEVSDDGVIYAANLVLGASEGTPFKVYRWADLDAEPEVAISFTANPFRLGDRLTVVGSESDNSVTIYAMEARTNQVVRFTTDDNGETFSHEVISLEGFTNSGIQPSVAPVAAGEASFFYNASPYGGEATAPGRNPALFAADGSLLHEFSGDWLNTNEMAYFEVGDRAFLATFEGAVDGDQRAAVFEVTDGGSTFMYRTPSMGAAPNQFVAGDVDVVVGDDDSVTLYVLASNAGIASYSLDLPEVFAGDFYVGAEGTAPNGADPHYSSLAEAFAAINGNEPTGPITLYITSDLDESDSELVLNGAAFTESAPLTIRPLTGTTPTVSLGAVGAEGGDAAASALALINTPYVTIDGSAEAGGTSRDLTLLVVDEGVTRAILIHGTSHNVTVRNANIEASETGAGMTAVRISLGDASPMGALVENSRLGSDETSFHIGVAFSGNDGQTLDSDIIGNDIYASYRGITTWWMDDARFENNRIWITGQYPTSTSATAWPAGMYLVLSSNLTVAGNEILEFTTNTEQGKFTGGFVINANLGDVWIYNNMIAVPEFSNNGAATDNEFFAIGVNNAAGAGTEYIYHNTVRIGESTQSGTVAAFGWDDAMQNTAMQWELRNNIFVVEHDAENAYAIYWPVPAGNEPETDDNVLYAPNASVGHWRGSSYESLSDWQFGTGFDGNSVSKAVEFISDTDLRLTGDSIGDRDLRGAPLEAVAVDIDGTERDPQAPYMGAFEGSVGLPIEGNQPEVAGAFELHQNYPNPFNPTTTIGFTLRDAGHVTLRVYNVAGQLVRELANGFEQPGLHEIRFDAGTLSSGMYIYRLEVDGQVESKQMVLVK